MIGRPVAPEERDREAVTAAGALGAASIEGSPADDEQHDEHEREHERAGSGRRGGLRGRT